MSTRSQDPETVLVANDPASGEWHLDKRIPVALIAALLMQAAAGLWWASSINARVEVLEAALLASSQDHDAIVEMRATLRSIDTRLERMENDDDSRR